MSLRLAFSRLLAAPMFTLFSVLSLASGVALTTAVYSVVDTRFLRDLGVPDPDRAAFIVASFGGRPLLARAYMDVEVAVVDPVMLLVTPVPLLLAAFCACYWPAARAAKVDPTVALRCE